MNIILTNIISISSLFQPRKHLCNLLHQLAIFLICHLLFLVLLIYDLLILILWLGLLNLLYRVVVVEALDRLEAPAREVGLVPLEVPPVDVVQFLEGAPLLVAPSNPTL